MVATGIDPDVFLRMDPPMLATVVDVLAEHAAAMKAGR